MNYYKNSVIAAEITAPKSQAYTGRVGEPIFIMLAGPPSRPSTYCFGETLSAPSAVIYNMYRL